MNARVEETAALPRPLDLVLDSEVAPVGTFTVRRALPARARHSVGPWVFLDHFGPFRVTPGKDGVGAHPHAGIETVTYLLSGRNEHRDSAGHVGIVSAGGAQWMTAGRGVVHAERPLADCEAEMTMHGIQLWTSLPRLQKLSEPRYQRIDADAIPRIERAGATVRVIAGDFEAVHGPAVTTDADDALARHARAEGRGCAAAIAPQLEAGLYVIEGRAKLDDEQRRGRRSWPCGARAARSASPTRAARDWRRWCSAAPAPRARSSSTGRS